VLLVFEDLHWIDSETQALLDSLVESLPTTRLLLLVNYRPEYAHGWARKTYYQQLRLDPLPTASAEALLQDLLGDDTGLAGLKRLLIERTEGNPFFLEEGVRGLVEMGVLVGERGTYRLGGAAAPIQVPATVQAVLAARVDRLDPADKRLLQCAAVIGKDVPYPLLQAIAELPETALRPALARLQTAEFLYEASLYPHLEYTFKHALTHEVTYSSVLQDRRRALHARIVDRIEERFGDRLGEQVERLAHHALRGEVWTKATTYLEQAGQKAARRSAYRDSVAYLKQALSALAHLPQDRSRLVREYELRIALRNSLIPLGEFDQLLIQMQEAERLAEELKDRERLGRAAALLTSHWWQMGDYARAVASGERALGVLALSDELELRASAAYFLARPCYSQGSYSRALDLLGQTIEVLGADRALDHCGLNFLLYPSALYWQALVLAWQGEFRAAITCGREGLRLTEVANHPFSISAASHLLGQVYLLQGDAEEAIHILERGRDICQTANINLMLPQILGPLGSAYALAGRPSDAMQMLEHAERAAAAMHTRDNESLRLIWLGEAYLGASQPTAASSSARGALEHARALGERGNEAWALRVLGEIAAHADQPDLEQAEARYRQALALAGELGMRPLAAHCHLGLGTLYQRIGREDEAQAELTTAAGLYRAMEMPFWLAKAEAVLLPAGG
jgi:tetratricopeptide (TPR) repeat protein